MLTEPILELPTILEAAKDLRCIDFTGNPMSSLPESCKKNAAIMLELLKTLQSILSTREIMAECDWESDVLAFLLTRSEACILKATIQNLGLTQHPKDIMLHDVVVLDLSRNKIDRISKELYLIIKIINEEMISPTKSNASSSNKKIFDNKLLDIRDFRNNNIYMDTIFLKNLLEYHNKISMLRNQFPNDHQL
jgi:hypothetical protein